MLTFFVYGVKFGSFLPKIKSIYNRATMSLVTSQFLGMYSGGCSSSVYRLKKKRHTGGGGVDRMDKSRGYMYR